MLSPFDLQGAIAYDSNYGSSVQNPSGGTISGTINIPANSDQIFFLMVSSNGDIGTVTPTIGGLGMTLISKLNTSSGDGIYNWLYYRLAPTQGASVTWQVTANTWNPIAVTTWSYSGVNQTTPLGTTASTIGVQSTRSQTVNFTPTSASSTMMFTQDTNVGGATTETGFSMSNGTARASTTGHNLNTNYHSHALGDWATGSTAANSNTLSWSAGTTGKNGITRAVELMPSASATNTPTYTPTPTQTPTGTVVAACASGMTVDGTIDEASWSSVGWTSIGTCWSGSCPTTASFKTLWSSGYLYIAVDVNDTTLTNDSGNNWEDDSVEIYFGTKPLSGTYDGNDWQWSLQHDNSNLIVSGAGGTTTGVLTARSAKAGGYYQEWAIPWSALGGITPAAGNNFGFDIGVNFDDGGGTREHQRGWYGGNTAWNDPTQFGSLILGTACPTATITPTFTATPTLTATSTPAPCVTYNNDLAVGTSTSTNGYTVTACSNQILLVVIQSESAGGAITVNWAGAAMTEIAGLAANSIPNPYMYTRVFYRVNPTAGANNVTIAGWGGSPVRVQMFTYCGVDTSSPIGTVSTNTATGANPYTITGNITPSQSLSTVLQMFALSTCSGNTTQALSVGTARASNTGGIWNTASFGLSDLAPGSTSNYSVTHTLSGGGACGQSARVEMMLELKAQCAVGTATVTPTLTTTPLCAVSDALNNSSLAPYWTGADIGGPLAGSQSEGSSLLINAGGADIWGTSDQFRYVYQSHCGDFDVRVRLNYGPATNSWAKSGIMLRDGTAANASFALIAATLDNNYQFAYRNGAGTNAVDGGTGGSYQNGTGGYLRLTRVGNGYSAYYSSDGSTWTQLGSTQTFTMTSCAVLGLAVTSHDNGNLGQASFNNFSMASGSCAAATATPTPTRSPTPNNTPTPETCGTAPGFCGDTMVMNGNAAAITAGSEYRLTDNGTWIRGSVWSPNSLNLSNNFDYSVEMNFGSNDGGADGMAFVIQDAGTGAIGSNGGNLGYGGLPTFSGGTGVSITPSIAVEFDTFRNLDQAGAEPDTNDPNYDHMMVLENGNMYHSGCPSTVTTADGNCPTGALAGNGNIETNTWYTVRITWNATTKQMQVYFNGVLRITYNRDLVRDIFNGSNCVYAGFTAASGGATNDQRVRFCLPTPTPTVTRTNSQSPSPSRTNSQTPSITPTFTFTRTVTRSFTASPAYSSTNTPVASPTPTQTQMAIPMTKSINVGSAVIGQTITYCITWQNASGGAASINIWDTVPIVMAYLSCWAQSGALTSCGYTPRLANFNIGAAVANGASGQVCFNAVITGYPWAPGFDTMTWLAAIARDEDIDPWIAALPGGRP